MKYAIIIEKGKRNYSAYAPDVPGCVTTGKTLAEVKRNMKEALDFHFEGMLLHQEPLPASNSLCAYVGVDVDKVLRRVRRGSRASSA